MRVILIPSRAFTTCPDSPQFGSWSFCHPNEPTYRWLCRWYRVLSTESSYDAPRFYLETSPRAMPELLTAYTAGGRPILRDAALIFWPLVPLIGRCCRADGGPVIWVDEL